MKKFTLLILLCLLGGMVAAQPKYHVRYWFDRLDTECVVDSSTTGAFHTLLNTQTLASGMHNLHVMVRDTGGRWRPPQTYPFFRVADTLPANPLRYTCWFDRDFDSRQSGNLAAGGFLLNADNLSMGIHNLHILVQDINGRHFAPQHVIFYRISDTLPDNPLRYTCWFDNDFESHYSGDVVSGNVLLNTTSLSTGLHNVHILVQDINGRYFAPQDAMFYRISDTMPNNPLRYTCWFDNDFDSHQSDDLVSGNVLLNATSLSTGLHNVHILVQDINGRYFAPQDAMFYRLPDTIANPSTTYTFWFDEDVENRQSGNIDGNTVLLDADNLATGMHILNMMFDLNGTVTLNRALFYKPPQPIANDTPLPYTFWFDNDFTHRVSGQTLSGVVLMDADTLAPGIHQVHLNVGSALHTYLFYRHSRPDPVVKYEYWYNDAPDSLHSAVAVNNLDTLNITQLIPVPSIPIRSTCFHFDPNADGVRPYVNAKNDLHYRVFDAAHRYSDLTKTYIDITVVDSVFADTLEGGETRTITAPYNDTIHWFQFASGVGDSIAFKASKRCTMQLFAPSGEMIWESSGRNVLYWEGMHTMENGNYYLAVHDAEDTNGTVDISFEWIYKYAVLAWDVHRVGNGGISSITFVGNGFNSLDTVFLIHGTDTLPTLYISRKTNTKLVVAFDFEGADTGLYRGAFRYVDEDIFKGDVVTVEPPRGIIIDHQMQYSQSFLRGSAAKYNYTITNTGNMTAYNIPIQINIVCKRENALSGIHIEGVDLPSFMDGWDMDMYTEEYMAEFEKGVAEMDDSYLFVEGWNVDTINHDSTYLRFTYIFVNLAPYETKNLRLSVGSLDSLLVLMRVADTIPPVTMDVFTADLLDSKYNDDTKVDWNLLKCCMLQSSRCVFSIVGSAAFAESIVFGVLKQVGVPNPSVAGASLVLSAVSCVSNAISNVSAILFKNGCNPNEDRSFTDILDELKWNLVGTLSGCIAALGSAMNAARAAAPTDAAHAWMNTVGESGFTVAEALLDAKIIKAAIQSAIGGLGGLLKTDCWNEIFSFNNDCSDTPPDGGMAYPYVPSDPNDIIGYTAESGSRYVGDEQMELPYIIEFENDTNFATAMAHTVVVTDTLDQKVFDLSSFSATGFSIGDEFYAIDGGKEFLQTVDLRPRLDVLAEVRLLYNEPHGIARWIFRSLNPLTLEDIEDPTLGFLPANYHGDGVGEVHFTINRKDNLRERDTISNSALIFFDNEDPIATPVWHNIMDLTMPTSTVDTVVFSAGTAKVVAHVIDSLSGAWRYHVYGQLGEAWMPLAMNVPADSIAIVIADSGQYDAIITTAVDSAGNVESLIRMRPCVTAYDAVTVTACDSYTWFDSIYTVSGEYEQTRPSSNPAFCDSVITLSLTIYHSVPLDITAGQWYAISTPMHNKEVGTSPDLQYSETVEGVINLVGNDFDYDLYYYDEDDGNWRNFKATSFDLEAGVGYIYRRSASATLHFNGQYNTGGSTGISVPLSASCVDNDLKGFNLIGNPYPHVVSYASPYFELRPNGTWFAHPSGTVGVAQGLLVHVSSSTSHTFDDVEADKGVEGDLQSPTLMFTISGNGYEDVAYAMVDSDGQHGYDGLPKIAHLNAGVPSLSVPVADNSVERQYAIAILGNETEEFPLALHAPDGDYTITASAIQSGSRAIKYLHLIDKFTDTDRDLLSQPVYAFKHLGTQATKNRFLVRLSPAPLGAENGLFAYTDGNSIVVTGNGPLSVFDVLGREMLRREVDQELRIPFSDLHAGVYVLRLGGKSQKIVIK